VAGQEKIKKRNIERPTTISLLRQDLTIKIGIMNSEIIVSLTDRLNARIMLIIIKSFRLKSSFLSERCPIKKDDNAKTGIGKSNSGTTLPII
jgi:hypothetical protein